MYVKIIDRGECFSTTMESVNGVYANRDTWAKHNFYPQNGMVGEVIRKTANAYIIKVIEGMYVPMSPNGVKEISEQEYQEGLKNNVCGGMDERQQRINNQLDEFNHRAGFDWHHDPLSQEINPIWQNAFRGELSNNLRKKSIDLTKQLYIVDVTTECVMYSCDMCLHFYKTGPFYGITPQIIDDITYNVCYAMQSVVKEFNSGLWNEVLSKVRQLMSDSTTYETLQQEVDNYYNRI